MICNKPNNDIDWRILEDSPIIHKILWIQYQPFPFLVHRCLVIVGGLLNNPIDSCIWESLSRPF